MSDGPPPGAMDQDVSEAAQAPRRPGRKHTVYSFPKVGRTWTTFLWYYYAMAVTGHRDKAESNISTTWAMMRPTKTDLFVKEVEPALIREHRPVLRFAHIMSIGENAEEMEAGLGQMRPRRHTLLVRNPFNAMPSYFHHIRTRAREYPESRNWTGVSDLIRSERFGIDRFIDYYRIMERYADAGQLVLHYEDMREDTAGSMRRLLAHAGHADINDEALAHAVEMTRFERLKQLERDAAARKGRNKGDNRMRFRSGRNTADEITDDDRAYVRRRLAAADVAALRRYAESG